MNKMRTPFEELPIYAIQLAMYLNNKTMNHIENQTMIKNAKRKKWKSLKNNSKENIDVE